MNASRALSRCALLPGLISVTAMLLVHSPDTHAQPAEASADVTSELIQAVRVGDAPQWRTLLSRESAQQRDSAGNTALHFAALNHDLAAVQALLAAGAD